MTFVEAVKSALSQYVGFAGRARRSEFWFFFLFTVLAGIVAGILDAILFDKTSSEIGPLRTLVDLALLLPSLAVAARRLHDTGRSAWWLLLVFVIIIGWIILVVWYCQDSEGDNQYGPSPKGAGAMQMPPYPGQMPPPPNMPPPTA